MSVVTTTVKWADGDINADGTVDLRYAILALQFLVGTGFASVGFGAEVNGDGKIGIEEVIYVLQVASGTRSH